MLEGLQAAKRTAIKGSELADILGPPIEDSSARNSRKSEEGQRFLRNPLGWEVGLSELITCSKFRHRDCSGIYLLLIKSAMRITERNSFQRRRSTHQTTGQIRRRAFYYHPIRLQSWPAFLRKKNSSPRRLKQEIADKTNQQYV